MNEDAGSHMEFTRKSLWWGISSVNTLADLRWKDMIVDIRAMQEKYEGGAMREQKAIDRAALELSHKDPEAMVEFLTRYCTNNANAVRDAWWALLDTLLCAPGRAHWSSSLSIPCTASGSLYRGARVDFGNLGLQGISRIPIPPNRGNGDNFPDSAVTMAVPAATDMTSSPGSK